LLLLAVDRSSRRRGVGRRLLEDFMEHARSQGATCAHLEVRENNDAIQMYKAAGFTTAGRRREYYNGSDGSRYDALTLARDL
jgi:ribosomal-protein-alanine N-acetyltransferase